jgi:hypothetical protein
MINNFNTTFDILHTIPFFCDCEWIGFSKDLSIINGLVCCPICHNLDVRVNLILLERKFNNVR